MIERLARAIFVIVALCGVASAQVPNQSGMGVPNSSSGSSAPCSAFGTTAGTCAQGGVITAGGPTGSATVAPIITYNAAGQLTTVSSATITPAIGSVTGLGTGVATALGTNVGSAGAPVVNGGALGTPSSGNLANTTGYPAAALPAATISTQGAIVSGCTSWTPTDQSGAGLAFTSVSAVYCLKGPAGSQEVSIYVTLTYPTTVSASNAAISLPVAVPNQTYAGVPGTVVGNSTGVTGAVVKAVPNTTTAVFVNNAFVATPNSTLSLKPLTFFMQYPVQ